MLLAFPVDELNEENVIKSKVSEHFGMANYVVFLDSRSLRVFVEDIKKFEKGMCSPARLIIERKPDVLVVKGIGYKAISLLKTHNISVLKCPEEENITIEKCLNILDRLKTFDLDDACRH